MTVIQEIKDRYMEVTQAGNLYGLVQLMNPKIIRVTKLYRANDLSFDINHIDARGYALQYDGNNLRISLFGAQHIVDVQLSGDCIQGDRAPFMLTSMGEEQWYTAMAPLTGGDIVIVSGGLPTGLSEVQVWKWYPESNETMVPCICGHSGQTQQRVIRSGLPITDSDVEHRPLIISPSLCHTWALKSKLGGAVVRKMRASNYEHATCFTIFSARASNIGVAYFDVRDGECIQPYEALAMRPERKFVGRSKSWVYDTPLETTLSTYVDLFSFEGRQGTGATHLLQEEGAVMEIFFPYRRFRVSTQTGGGKYLLCGGGVAITEGPYNGTYRRVYTKNWYDNVHPLGEEEINITTFKREYIPEEGLVFGVKTLDIGVDEEMTPTEKEQVKKWFAAYVASKARQGESLSDDELQVAKDIGVYTGN